MACSPRISAATRGMAPKAWQTAPMEFEGTTCWTYGDLRIRTVYSKLVTLCYISLSSSSLKWDNSYFFRHCRQWRLLGSCPHLWTLLWSGRGDVAVPSIHTDSCLVKSGFVHWKSVVHLFSSTVYIIYRVEWCKCTYVCIRYWKGWVCINKSFLNHWSPWYFGSSALIQNSIIFGFPPHWPTRSYGRPCCCPIASEVSAGAGVCIEMWARFGVWCPDTWEYTRARIHVSVSDICQPGATCYPKQILRASRLPTPFAAENGKRQRRVALGVKCIGLNF